MINRCTHCGQAPCLAFWRELTLGPTGSARCLQYDCKVGLTLGPAVTSTAATALVPFLLLFLVLLKLALGRLELDFVPVSALLAAAFLVVALAGRWYRVPLRVDELSNAQTVAEGETRVARAKES